MSEMTNDNDKKQDTEHRSPEDLRRADEAPPRNRPLGRREGVVSNPDEGFDRP